MRLHEIEEDELPFKIRFNLEKYKKTLSKNSVHNINTDTTGTDAKSASTGRKPMKHKIDTNLSHVAVTGGDMVTLRNKDKKVNIKKGLEESVLDSLSSKSKSITRNKKKENSARVDLSTSNGDSMKALDDLMSGPSVKKQNNQNYVVKKHKITFMPVRNRKPRRQDKLTNSRETSKDYNSMPVTDPFAPSDLNNMISKGKSIMKNNFFA